MFAFYFEKNTRKFNILIKFRYITVNRKRMDGCHGMTKSPRQGSI